MNKLHTSPFNIAVIASGLGFFIDAFDLFLFTVYRRPSLVDLQVPAFDIQHTGEHLLAIQMLGMMIGGVLSGVLGDKFGRVSVLFGSIILYSFSNIANAFVTDIDTYAVIRFLAGAGLAGELGAGITLVSESMTIEKRGYGTILVATLGALGAVSAGLISDFIPWRYAFFGAGVIGLALLLLRMKSMETGMFHKSKSDFSIKRGSLLLLFNNRNRLYKYIACILMGVPIWYSVGLLITLSPEIASLQHINGLKLSYCFTLFQVGITVGDLSSGMLSQYFKTRKYVILSYMGLAIVSTVIHFYFIFESKEFYTTSLFMGLGCGYLSVFVTSTAEHFGINLRVLVTATVTNFMRGAVTLLIPFHIWLEHTFNITVIFSLLITGIIVWSSAILSTLLLPETYGKNLDYIEK